MKPFSESVLSDVTPIVELSPVGPFGVLVQMPSGVYRVEVQPYRRQWTMDVTDTRPVIDYGRWWAPLPAAREC